jgi:LmbE family N-acetylglucosaminyl deacetylase
MCVTAHPDDESYAFGGALLLAHARHADTTIICLTEGRAASNRGDTRSDDELASARIAELDISCGILGVTRWEVWKYPDGALIQANLFEITTRLVERMRELRPHIVLTFGGDGGANLHRDHAVAGFATTAAFHGSGRSNFAPEHLQNGLTLWAPQKLYYSSTPFTVSKFKEEAALAPRIPYSVRLQLGPLKELKGQAVEAHETQIVISRDSKAFEKFGHEEDYLLASARNPERFKGETDIFFGIEED